MSWNRTQNKTMRSANRSLRDVVDNTRGEDLPLPNTRKKIFKIREQERESHVLHF